MRLTAVAALLTLAACAPRVQAGHELALPSGRKVMVLSVHLIGDNGGTLRLRYQADNIYDIAGRRAEADEIWPLLRPEAERWGYAEIDASDGSQRRTRFVYRKSKDGAWQRVIDGELE